MRILLDSNILLRLCNPLDVLYAEAETAVKNLSNRHEDILICPQNLIEFRAAATRPVAVNGLGYSSQQAEGVMAQFENEFPLLPDTPDIFPNWKSIVAQSQVLGKHVHDARLVAVAVSAGVDAILTFNTVHFQRLCAANGLQLLDPRTI